MVYAQLLDNQLVFVPATDFDCPRVTHIRAVNCIPVDYHRGDGRATEPSVRLDVVQLLIDAQKHPLQHFFVESVHWHLTFPLVLTHHNRILLDNGPAYDGQPLLDIP